MTVEHARIAVVTGAARGIGAAIVRELSATGVVVVACDIDATAVEELAADLSRSGAVCEPRSLDVTDLTEVRRVVDATVTQFGRIDVLVNNAGVGSVAASEDLAHEVWERVLGVNLTGPFLCSQAAGRVMLRQGRRVIVNVASIFGVAGMPQRAAYAASKHGLLGLTKVLATEWAPRGVRVVAVNPPMCAPSSTRPISRRAATPSPTSSAARRWAATPQRRRWRGSSGSSRATTPRS